MVWVLKPGHLMSQSGNKTFNFFYLLDSLSRGLSENLWMILLRSPSFDFRGQKPSGKGNRGWFEGFMALPQVVSFHSKLPSEIYWEKGWRVVEAMLLGKHSGGVWPINDKKTGSHPLTPIVCLLSKTLVSFSPIMIVCKYCFGMLW